MYMFRPVSVYLGCILSIWYCVPTSAPVKADENPEVLRGSTAGQAPPSPKSAVARCGNLMYGYAQDDSAVALIGTDITTVIV